MLDRIRIVLVRPSGPANIGSVCRAMKNTGLSDLVLVEPRCELTHPDAIGFAARARAQLDAARTVNSVADALRGCVLTFAATGKGGIYRKQAGVSLEDAAALALEATADGRVTIAFGPEDRGLKRHELLDFDRVIEIPANPAYPVFNLAAAVLIVGYELRRTLLGGDINARDSVAEPVATDERKQVLYDKLFGALERIGYFRGQQSADHLRFALRRVFGRVQLSEKEVDVFIGMARQIHWYADHHRPPGNPT